MDEKQHALARSRYRAPIRFTVSFSSPFHAYYPRMPINRIYFEFNSMIREERHSTVPLLFLFATVAWNACIHKHTNTRTHMHAFLSREAAKRVTVTRLYRILIEKRDRASRRRRPASLA